MHVPQPDSREVHRLRLNGKDLVFEWLRSLDDARARAAVRKRIDRIEAGNFGDHRFVGDGVWEIRIHFGPGYRLYYGEDEGRIILLICGGEKSTQRRDIARAQMLWAWYRKLK